MQGLFSMVEISALCSNCNRKTLIGFKQKAGII